MFFDIDRQIINIQELKKFIIGLYGDFVYEQLENEEVQIEAVDKNTNYSLKSAVNVKIINELTDVTCVIILSEQVMSEWRKHTKLNWESYISTLAGDFHYDVVKKELVISTKSRYITITKYMGV